MKYITNIAKKKCLKIDYNMKNSKSYENVLKT